MPLARRSCGWEMTVDRRGFLREAILGAGVVACGVGGLWVRCARARSHVVEQLMDSARPVLDKYALDEQEQIPVSAGNKVRAYFDQNCLNTAEFVGEISTPEFRKKLGKIRPGDRRQ